VWGGTDGLLGVLCDDHLVVYDTIMFRELHRVNVTQPVLTAFVSSSITLVSLDTPPSLILHNGTLSHTVQLPNPRTHLIHNHPYIYSADSHLHVHLLIEEEEDLSLKHIYTSHSICTHMQLWNKGIIMSTLTGLSTVLAQEEHQIFAAQGITTLAVISPTSLCFARDTHIVMLHADRGLWDFLKEFPISTGQITCLSSSTGNTIVSLGIREYRKIYTLNLQTEVLTLLGDFHTSSINSISAPLRKSLLLTSSESRVILHNYLKGGENLTSTYKEYISCLAIHPDGHLILVVSPLIVLK